MSKKSQSAQDFIKKVSDQGYMVYIGGAGQPRTSPLLPPDLHAEMTENAEEIKKLLMGGSK